MEQRTWRLTDTKTGVMEWASLSIEEVMITLPIAFPDLDTAKDELKAKWEDKNLPWPSHIELDEAMITLADTLEEGRFWCVSFNGNIWNQVGTVAELTRTVKTKDDEHMAGPAEYAAWSITFCLQGQHGIEGKNGNAYQHRPSITRLYDAWKSGDPGELSYFAIIPEGGKDEPEDTLEFHGFSVFDEEMIKTNGFGFIDYLE